MVQSGSFAPSAPTPAGTLREGGREGGSIITPRDQTMNNKAKLGDYKQKKMTFQLHRREQCPKFSTKAAMSWRELAFGKLLSSAYATALPSNPDPRLRVLILQHQSRPQLTTDMSLFLHILAFNIAWYPPSDKGSNAMPR